jgi:hypothetical protein
MVAVRKEILCLCGEMVGELGNLLDDAQRAQGGLQGKVRA